MARRRAPRRRRDRCGSVSRATQNYGWTGRSTPAGSGGPDPHVHRRRHPHPPRHGPPCPRLLRAPLLPRRGRGDPRRRRGRLRRPPPAPRARRARRGRRAHPRVRGARHPWQARRLPPAQRRGVSRRAQAWPGAAGRRWGAGGVGERRGPGDGVRDAPRGARGAARDGGARPVPQGQRDCPARDRRRGTRGGRARGGEGAGAVAVDGSAADHDGGEALREMLPGAGLLARGGAVRGGGGRGRPGRGGGAGAPLPTRHGAAVAPRGHPGGAGREVGGDARDRGAGRGQDQDQGRRAGGERRGGARVRADHDAERCGCARTRRSPSTSSPRRARTWAPSAGRAAGCSGGSVSTEGCRTMRWRWGWRGGS